MCGHDCLGKAKCEESGVRVAGARSLHYGPQVMTALTRPWRAFLSLFAHRAGAAGDDKWVEPWNAITLAVLYGDPARFERQAAVNVPAISIPAGVGIEVHRETASLEPEARDYFAPQAMSEGAPSIDDDATIAAGETTQPSSEERAA